MEQGSWEQGLEAPWRIPRNARGGPRSLSAESWQVLGWRGVNTAQPSTKGLIETMDPTRGEGN